MALLNKKTIGNFGEKVAVKFLKKNKYKIIETNYKTKYGEIDIICRNKEYIVFVEVKTRKNGSPVPGAYAVDKKKQYHIFTTASSYIKETKCNKQPRFDVIIVKHYCDGTYRVEEHYVNAFTQGGNYGVF